jgi:radical SAM protein with 4Fe4S-binding SPASM domain
MSNKNEPHKILLRRERGRGAVARIADRALYLSLTPFRLRATYRILLRLKYFIRYRTTDFFNDVNIETSTVCNRRCGYCPNSVSDRSCPENAVQMPASVYKSLIDQLAEIGFDGRVSPHGYGEPLIDARLLDLIVYTRQRLPCSRIWIYTNGDFLTPSRYEELVDAGADRFVISQHDREMSPAIRELFAHFKRNRRRADILYMKLEKGTTPLSNRGGLVDPGLRNIPRCGDPDNPLVINAEGFVVLCSNDYYGRVTFGHVGKRRLLDIWNSPDFREIRRNLRRRRYTLPICRRCTGQA